MQFIKSVLFLFFLISSYIYSQNNSTCISCHSDKDLYKESGKKKISLYLDEKIFNNSVHKDLECTDCHEKFDPENIPHKENITPVNCQNCHEIKGYKEGLHGKKQVKCSSCHSEHGIKSASQIKTSFNICYECHKTNQVNLFSGSSHQKAGLICESCHKSPHNPEKIFSARSNLQCLSCHKLDSPKLSKNIHHTKLDFSVQSKNKCIDCHNPHSSGNNMASDNSKNCMKCHLNENLFSKDSKIFQITQDYNVSIHSQKNQSGKTNATCADCHGPNFNNDKNSPVTKLNQPKTCGKCHQEQSTQFLTSGHGISLQSNENIAPSCSDCHGNHKILSHLDSTSMVSRENEKDLCFSCHIKNQEVSKRLSVSTNFIKSFERSVHYREFVKGNKNAAVCSDCHSSHGILQASKPNSTISKQNIAKSCSNCHSEIYNEYSESIHSVKLVKGNLQSATCTDCHSEHEILESTNKNSQVYLNNVAIYTCAKCHADTKFSDKYGIIGYKYQTYTDSYHGLAVQGGSKVSANCASCHGYHNIKLSTDPTSTTHKSNLPKTCGKCHPGANENFTKDPVHVYVEKTESPILFWVSNIYVILIILIVGGMLIHNLLDFYRKSRRKLIERRFPASFYAEEDTSPEKIPHRLFLRMSLNERIQHAILFISFTLLVLTGFGLTYPNSWWVLLIRSVLGDWAFTLRALIHRIAGAAMTLVSLYHVYYIFFVPRGKQLLKDLLPVKKDLQDLIGNIKFLRGKVAHPPKFDRFGYIEKAEYWALVWGTIVMAITGFILWFAKDVINISGKFITDLSTVIHFYEAWLATLAIIVWHFYFVIFNPDVYPINLAFLKGTISEEEMKHEHPLEYERLLKKEQAEKEDKN